MLALLSIAAAGALGAAPADAARGGNQCRPTPQDAFGPFGRGLPPERKKIGSGHVLTGVVLSAVDCRPIRGALVQFWQANRRYEYTRRLSATVRANRAGRFRFEGPYPASARGREPHIHIRVFARGHAPLLTRYVPAKGSRRGSIRLVLELSPL